MTKRQKIKNLVAGLLMLICVPVIIYDPQNGYYVVLALVDITLLVSSINGFIFYFSMARYMVDGRRILYKNLLFLDLAIFCCVLMNIPSAIVVTYLVCLMGFAAIVDLIYGLQAKKLKSPVWKRKLAHGSIELIIVIACLIFPKNSSALIYLYSIGLIYSGFMRISTVFKKTEMPYVIIQ